MDAIKSILVKEIERINRQEGRDGKLRFNSEFAAITVICVSPCLPVILP